MLPFVSGLLGLTLAIYALVDCARTPEERVRGLPKLWWVCLVALVTFVGPIAWLIAGRPRKVALLQAARAPIGPEDDPEFLRRLRRGTSPS
jgi:hypothetical protein